MGEIYSYFIVMLSGCGALMWLSPLGPPRPHLFAKTAIIVSIMVWNIVRHASG